MTHTETARRVGREGGWGRRRVWGRGKEDRGTRKDMSRLGSEWLVAMGDRRMMVR